MAVSHYEWKDGPAVLKQHSIAKHALLRSYLSAYFPTLIGSPNQDVLRLTIVDGFAGGGLYKHVDTSEVLPGSPLICLQAAQEAEYLVNGEGRHKKVRFDIDFIFVEKNKHAAQFLKTTLTDQGYADRFDKNVFPLVGDFNDHAEAIIKKVKAKTPRSGRAIFVLDQYGYGEVPMPLLATIFRELPRAEVILTFNVDSFSSFATDKNSASPLARIGLPNVFEGKTIEEIKNSDANWRAFIQSQLYEHIVKAAGSKHHTPFFIRSTKGHGDFWLLHLSMHQKARDVMTEVHWQQGNTFIHYGDAGLDMFKLGYITNADERYTKQNKLGFTFDDDARDRTGKQLLEDIPRLIYSDDDGFSFETLHATTCNNTPATSRIYKEVIVELAQAGEVEIVTSSGGTRHSPNTIKDDDRIRPPRQRRIFD